MNIEKLTIDEAKQLAAMFGSVATAPASTVVDHGIQIVIADRGFVYLGRVKTDSEWVYVRDALNLRVWGTTKGLGELVKGPLANTKTDATGNIKISRKALIALVEVEGEAWNSKL